jgi:hypothetical protein
MTRFLSIAAMGAGLMFAIPVSANAAPPSPQAPGAETTIEKVHGYHRSCRYGHRHQRDGDRVGCGGYYYRDSAPSIYLNLGRDRDRHHGQRRHDGRRDRH